MHSPFIKTEHVANIWVFEVNFKKKDISVEHTCTHNGPFHKRKFRPHGVNGRKI